MITPLPATGYRILGVDPGLNTTGYSLIELTGQRPKLIEAGVIRGGNHALEIRLRELHRGLVEIIEALRPQVMAIEQLYSHYQRPRTAILMGHARGVACLAAANGGLPIAHYAATQVKKMLTGSGRASKSQVQAAITREFALKEPPEPHDVADALAIALCHVYLGRVERLVNQ